MKKKQQGSMNLRLLFNSDGKIEKVAVLEASCPRDLLDYTVLWAIRNWRAEPSTGFQGGYKDVPVTYRLR